MFRNYTYSIGPSAKKKKKEKRNNYTKNADINA